MAWRLAAGALAGLAVLWTGHDRLGAPDDVQRHERGREVYNFRCYFCHGYSGDAKTLAATFTQPPPRDFTRAAGLTAAQIVRTLHEGRPGTAMASYRGTLSEREIADVAAFVEREFVQAKAPNTAYHTAANGWPDHRRYAAAFPFATGAIALDTPPETLSEAQRAGRTLFVETCISCHDRARVDDEGPVWSSRPVSYPRFGFAPGDPLVPKVDAVSSASVYAKHEVPPPLENASALERRGEAVFQANCAFCHGADGTGKNWIGQFMEPKARDLTQYTATSLPKARFQQVVRDGLEGTSMPAWKHVLKPAEIDAVTAYVAKAMFRPAP